MIDQSRHLPRLGARLSALGTFAMLIGAALLARSGEWKLAGLTFAIALAANDGIVWSAIALGGSLRLGLPNIVVAGAAASLLAKAISRLAPLSAMSASFDAGVLVGEADRTFQQLGDPDVDSPITISALLDGTSRSWAGGDSELIARVREMPPDESELLADGAITLQAAEALALARHLADVMDRPMAPAIAALGAAIVPGTGGVPVDGRLMAHLVERTGAHEQQIQQAVTGFIATAAGARMLKRLSKLDDVGRVRRFPAPIRLLGHGLFALALVVAAPLLALRGLWRWLRRPGRTIGAARAGLGSMSQRIRVRTAARRSKVSEHFRSWSRLQITCWWVLRPLSTIASVVVVIVTAVDRGSWGTAALAIAPLVVRPVRRWWAMVLPMAALAPLVPVGSAILLVRVVVSEVALRSGEAGRFGGLELVAASRRGILGVRPFAAVREDMMAAIDGEDVFDVIDEAFDLVPGAWATGDAARLVEAVGLFLTGLAAQVTGVNAEGQMVRLVVVDTALRTAVGVVVAGIVAVLSWGRATGDLDLRVGSVPTSLVLALSVVAVIVAGARKRPFAAIVLAAIAFAVIRDRSLLPLAGAVLTGLIIPKLTQKVSTQLSVGGNARTPVRFKDIAWPHLGAWTAARRSLRSSTPRIATMMWDELALRPRLSKTSRVYALATAASSALADGDVDGAITRARRAEQVVGAPAEALASALERQAEVLISIGSHGEALKLVDRAAELAPGSLGPQSEILRAEAWIRAGRSDEAYELLQSLRRRVTTRAAVLSILEVELVAVAALLRTGDQRAEARLTSLMGIAEFTFPEVGDRDRLREIEARAHYLMGRIQIERGERVTAVASLRKAATHADRNGPNQVRAASMVFLASALVADDQREAVALALEGTEIVEQRRGELRWSDHRADAIVSLAEIYSCALDTFGRCVDVPSAGQAAADLVESLHRSAIAAMLSTAREPSADFAGTAKEFSAWYSPERARVGNAPPGSHVLMYHLSRLGDVLGGHCVWLRPGRSPEIMPVSIADEDQLDLLGVNGADRRRSLLHRPMGVGEPERWRRLTSLLLPDELLLELDLCADDDPTRIIVVPEGVLFQLPWAAMRVTADRLLVECAVVQLTTSLSALRPAVRPTAGGVAAVIQDLPGHELERSRLASFGVEVGSLGHLTERIGTVDGVYLAAHGKGSGLEQHLDFGAAGRLSASSAFAMRWPRWAVVAGCFVASLDANAGEDPIGLPIAAFIRGAETFVGGVVDVESIPTSEIAVATTVALLRGEDPAMALRNAQISWLDANGWEASPHQWASLVAFSRRSSWPAAND